MHGETLRQLEHDADTEIEELKRQYKERLNAEHDDKVLTGPGPLICEKCDTLIQLDTLMNDRMNDRIINSVLMLYDTYEDATFFLV